MLRINEILHKFLFVFTKSGFIKYFCRTYAVLEFVFNNAHVHIFIKRQAPLKTSKESLWLYLFITFFII